MSYTVGHVLCNVWWKPFEQSANIGYKTYDVAYVYDPEELELHCVLKTMRFYHRFLFMYFVEYTSKAYSTLCMRV